MEHERLKEWLYLSVFDELGEEEKSVLEDHVLSCGECLHEREEIVRMLEAMTESGAGEPSEEMLQSARQSLRAALWKESLVHAAVRKSIPREGLLTRLLGIDRTGLEGGFHRSWFRRHQTALSATVMVCLGFVLGCLVTMRVQPGTQYLQTQTGLQTQPVAEGRYTSISDVRFIDADAADGEVEIVYNQVRPVHLKTRVNDRQMREVLSYALLKDDNPGVRLEAIKSFETDRRDSPPEDMKQAFLEVLNTDPNAGVRLQALLIVRRFPFDEEIKRSLLFVLSHDDNPGMRIAVMNYLAQTVIDGVIPEKELYDILRTFRTSDRNNYVHNGQGV
jgi:hypothetical protein